MFNRIYVVAVCIPLTFFAVQYSVSTLLRNGYFFYLLPWAILSTFVLNYFEIITPFDWIRHKIRIGSALFHTFETMSKNVIETKFSINDSRKSASIVYSRHGNEHLLNIPYRRNLRAKMGQYDVILIREKDDTEIPITINQQPGIPYLVSVNDLGGTRIEIKDRIEGKLVKTYYKDEIPDPLEWKSSEEIEEITLNY